MASHHHPTYPTPPPTCFCHCCLYTPCRHHHHPPPPPDSHLLHHHHPPQPHLPNLNQHNPCFERYFQEEREINPTISSLLRRISALESALRRLRSSSSFHSLRDVAARTIQTHFRTFLLRRSRTLRQLKELAFIKSKLGILKSAVSDKTHLSYYVVYHKALTLLLKLDTIQGGDPMIRDGKISISKELNNFLDFIDGFCKERRGQSSGANARYKMNNVKSRDSNHERKTGNLRRRVSKSVNEEKLRGLIERIDKLAEELDDEEIESPTIRKHNIPGNRTGDLVKQHGGTIRPKVQKSVSFVENGKVYRLLRRNCEPILDEDCDDSIDKDNLVDAREIEDDLCKEVGEMGVSSKEAEDDEEEEDQSENGGSLCESDGEKDLSIPRSEGNFVRRHNESRTDNFIFSAPLPVKMETRAELIDKRKKIAQ